MQTQTQAEALKKGVHGVHQNAPRKPEPPRVVIETEPSLKRDLKRTAELRGRTLTELLHKPMRDLIKKAKEEFPGAFGQMSYDEEVVLEAVADEGLSELREIATYCRKNKEDTQEILNGLVLRGRVEVAPGKKTDIARGASKLIYRVVEKKGK